jgi:hypothetical protein
MGFLNANVLSMDAAPKGLGERLAALMRGAKRNGTPALRHVETLSLGPRRLLYLVECDGERFLVSGGDGLSAPVPLTQQFVMRPSAEQQQ